MQSISELSEEDEHIQLDEVRIEVPAEDNDQQVYQDLLTQTAIDLLSFVSARASVDQQSTSDLSARFVSTILRRLAESGDWANAHWVKFVFMLIVCNGAGASQGVTSAALDFEDTVQARFLRLLTGEAPGRSIVDTEMLAMLTNSLTEQIT